MHRILALLLSVCTFGAAFQAEPVKVRVHAILVDRDLNQKPVPFLAVAIEPTDAASAPVQIKTALDGTAETSLPPGSYTLRSVEPLEFQGKTYRWEMQLMVSQADMSVDLNNGNAVITDIDESESLPALFERLKNAVVTIQSEFGQGTGFLIDPSGLLLTNAHVVHRSEYLSAQFDDRRKVRVKLLTSDLEKDLAILWMNPAAFPEAIVAPIGSLAPSAVGQAVFTVGNPLDNERVLTSGLISRVEATRIVSDINTNPGNSGGPLFNSTGEVIGVTTFVSQGRSGPGLSGVIRIEEAMPLLQQAETRRDEMEIPLTSLLPVVPHDPYPADALMALAVSEKVESDPYQFSVGDFDVTIFTPALAYRISASTHLRLQMEQRKRKEKRGSADSESTKPWEVAAERGDFKPLMIVHVAPKTRRKFWASWGASIAAGEGKNVAVKEFKTDFYRMKLSCGGKEVEPVHPGRTPVVLDDKSGETQITDSTYLGWYSYLPSAITPDCGRMTIEILADKNVPPVTKALGTDTINAVWNDFAAYRGSAEPATAGIGHDDVVTAPSDAPELPPLQTTAIGDASNIPPPKKIKDVAPVYPVEARRAHIEGQVILRVAIDTEGNVGDVQVVQSIPLLDRPAIEAVRQWKYEPALQNGVPVPITITVTVGFALDQ